MGVISMNRQFTEEDIECPGRQGERASLWCPHHQNLQVHNMMNFGCGSTDTGEGMVSDGEATHTIIKSATLYKITGGGARL